MDRIWPTGENIVGIHLGDKGMVFDSDGNEVKSCYWANLKTGEALVVARDVFGRILTINFEVMATLKQFKPPLVFKARRHGIRRDTSIRQILTQRKDSS